MAKQKAKEPTPAALPIKKRPTQTKLELPAEELEEVRRVARSIGLTLASFVKMAVLKEVRRVKEGIE
jgi:hypothetical protein